MNDARWQHLTDGLGVIACITLSLAFIVVGSLLVQEVRKGRQRR